MVRLELPWPPTLNLYYRHDRGRTHISAEGQKYRAAVGIAVAMAKARWEFEAKDRIEMTIRANPPDARRRDIDNVLKALLDALERAQVYQDDSQIDKLTVERGEQVDGGWVVVTMEKIG